METKPMTDVELAALTVLVRADTMGMEAANAQRAFNEYSPAYTDETEWPELERLREELKHRHSAKPQVLICEGIEGES